MRFDVMTLFPETVDYALSQSIIGRARKAGLIELFTYNIRDFSKDKHRSVDDYPYGGGAGMIMTFQPVYDCYLHVCAQAPEKPHCVYLSPRGRVLDQRVVAELAGYKRLCLLCGHYEGVDQRAVDAVADEEISLGDFVLTGGEVPAIALIDAVSRMVPGVLSCERAYAEESHYGGLLEYPQYTRPAEVMGMQVPEVLLSGHHAEIEKWRRRESLRITFERRPELLSRAKLTEEEREWIKTLRREDKNPNQEGFQDAKKRQ